MLISEVINKLSAFHPAVDEAHTCDTVKCGDPGQECSGIVVTCFASVEVIRKTIELGANLIIVHEPLFWNHEDKTDWLAQSQVFAGKKKLLDSNGIVVWRDHDRIHGGPPSNNPEFIDGIFYGIMQELGWAEYKLDYPNKPLLFKLPETDAVSLGLELKEKLGLNGIRIVGDKNAKVSKVFLCEHLRDADREVNSKIIKTELEDIDAIIPLEIVDWTLCAFVRDCCALGKSKVIYNIGHFNFEEPGMKFMCKYLPRLVGDVPVHYVRSGDSFDFIV